MSKLTYVAGIALLVVFSSLGGCNLWWFDDAAYPYDNELYGAILPSPREIRSFPKAISPLALAPSSDANQPASTQIAEPPPVGQQGPCSACTSQGAPGSCIAWSFGYGLGSITANIAQQWGINDANHLISPAFLYEYVLREQQLACPVGTKDVNYVNYLAKYGAVSLTTAPYVAECDELNQVNLDDPPNPKFRIGSWTYIHPTDRDLIKQHLAAGHPVAFSGHLYVGFGDLVGNDVYYGSGPFEVSKKTGKLVGHGMLLIGYDDNIGDQSKGLGAYRLQNSFGTFWGDAGRLWMSYDTFESSILACYTAEPLEAPQPAIAALTPDSPSAAAARITAAIQWDHVENGEPHVFLIFKHQFDAPVELGEIAVTDPSGKIARHTYNTWHNNGYTHLSRNDGFQFTAGDYQLAIKTTQLDGTTATYTAQISVPAIPGSPLRERPFRFGILGGNGERASVN